MTATRHDDAQAPLIYRPGSVCEYGAVTDIPGSPASGSDAESDVQDGVRRIEAVSQAWSKWGLVVAYMRFENTSYRGTVAK